MLMKMSFISPDKHFSQSPKENSNTQMLTMIKQVFFCLQNGSV